MAHKAAPSSPASLAMTFLMGTERTILGLGALPDILNSFGVGVTDAENPLVRNDEVSSQRR